METSSIVTLIGTVGFPIVACLAMAWYVKYITDKNRDDMNSVRDDCNAQQDKVINALNNNTAALAKLSEKLEGK